MRDSGQSEDGESPGQPVCEAARGFTCATASHPSAAHACARPSDAVYGLDEASSTAACRDRDRCFEAWLRTLAPVITRLFLPLASFSGSTEVSCSHQFLASNCWAIESSCLFAALLGPGRPDMRRAVIKPPGKRRENCLFVKSRARQV